MAAPEGIGGSVLVVDDDPESLTLLKSVLEEEGYHVQPADSGKLALISVAAQPPELILLDVRMPGMDGFEVCRRIKSTEGGRRIPLMFISATKDVDEWVEGLALGAVDFVSKPFRREELLARVRTHVELGRLQANLEARVAQRTAELHNALEQLRIEVAERRSAEQAARESEARFRQVANAAPAIIWTSDCANRIDFLNEHAQRFTGRAMGELAGDGWMEVVHPEDRERRQRKVAEAMRSRDKFQFEYRVLRADGEYRWMLDTATPRYLADGDSAGYAGIAMDFTDVKRSQERAFESRNLENLRVLSAGIAHDFNTLIGAIFGEADLALSDMSADARERENVDRILGLAKRAADIVKLLMAYGGDPSGEAIPELVDLNLVVKEIVPHLKLSTLHRAKVSTDLDDNLPCVWVKGLQIRQVILNLILNGIEALERQPGVVSIATSRVVFDSNSFVKLEVSDSGRGMSEEVQARVFDPYFSTKFPGRGLGLAAVQGIIRSHGGRITARSSPGEGSTFEVLLPAGHN